MASFSTPDNVQVKELYRELEQSFYERYQVMAPASTPSWSLPANRMAAAVNIQANTVWKDWYDRVTQLLTDAAANSSYFLRTTSGGANYEDDLEGSISIYNGSADVGALWLAAVGNSAGPRRLTSADVWTYGRNVTGDGLGPWLIEDMQKALKKLTHTMVLKDGACTYQPPLYWDGPLPGDDDRTYMLQVNAPWRIYWGRSYSTSGTEQQYASAKTNHDWLTGHQNLYREQAGNIVENPLVAEYQSNRLAAMMRVFYGGNLTAAQVVASVTEAGSVTLSGLPTAISHDADLYLVLDEVHMPEIEWKSGEYLAEGEYWIDYGIPPPGDEPATIDFQPLNYAGRISGPGRYVKVQDYGTSYDSSHMYNFNPSRSFPAWNSSEYNLFGFGGFHYDNAITGGKNIPWKGCMAKKETTWIIQWNWSYT